MFHIDICGHGPLFEEYSNKVKVLDLDIKMHGWVEPAEYTRLMSETDVYIHASLEEPFGIPPLDAMYKKKVVVVSDGVKSTDRIIDNGVNGFMYKANDAVELARILLSLNRDDFASIGEKAHETVAKNYSIQRNIESLNECFS